MSGEHVHFLHKPFLFWKFAIPLSIHGKLYILWLKNSTSKTVLYSQKFLKCSKWTVLWGFNLFSSLEKYYVSSEREETVHINAWKYDNNDTFWCIFHQKKKKKKDKYIHNSLGICKNIIFRVRKKKYNSRIHRNGSTGKNFCCLYSDFQTEDGFSPIRLWKVFNGICKCRYFWLCK